MKKKLVEETVVINETEALDQREPRRYELGYLLVPILATTAVSGTVETLIRGTITKLGGEIIDGEEPKLIPIMYPIRKTVENKNLRFKEAYFASIRFLLAPDQVTTLDQTLRFSPDVLRFLIIDKPAQVEEPPRREPKMDDNASTPASGEVMSQTEMDKEIDSLLTATA